MDHFVSSAKFGILKFCHNVSIESSEESVIGCIVGEEFKWTENQAVVSFVAEVCASIDEKSKLTRKCESLDKDVEHYKEMIDSLKQKVRDSQQESIMNAYNLEAELRDLKENNLVLRNAYNVTKSELTQANSKLVEVEMYMNSEEGSFTVKLEEELAIAKLRLAELESEKDDWEMQNTDRSGHSK